MTDVDKCEGEEVLGVESEIQRLTAYRNMFIAYLARKYGVDLKSHNYDVTRGCFLPKESDA